MEDNFKILIADDEPEILSLLEKALKLEGFNNVIKAQNGTDAVSLCKKEAPDAVILDIMMPGMDGYEVCKKIREFSIAPILFLSSKNDEVDKPELFINIEAANFLGIENPETMGIFELNVEKIRQ